MVDSDNAKSKLYRISSTSGQCRDQVPPGGLGCGMNCTEIFLDCGQSYRTEEDGLVMESQKKKLVKGSQAEANGTPTEVGGMSGKTRGINTHTRTATL